MVGLTVNTIVKFFLIGSAFLASMTCNVVAQSDTANNPVPTPGQCDQGGKHWSHDPLAKLNLTEDQKSQVQPIMQKARDEMKAIHEDSTLTQEQKGQQIQTIKQSTDEQLKSILTPDQFQKYQQMKSEWKNKNKEGEHGRHNLFEKLNLSTAQQDQVQTVMQKSKADTKVVKENAALTADQKKEQIKTIRQGADEQLKSILTPEQYQKLQEMRAHHKGGHHHPESSSTPAAIPPTT